MKSKLFPIAVQSLLALALLVGCTTSAPTPAQTTAASPVEPTATTPAVVDLDGRDLSLVVLQPGEVPAEFKDASTEDFAMAFPTVTIAHEQIKDSMVVMYQTEDDRRIYSSGVVLYESEDQAQTVFKEISKSTRPDTAINVPDIGTQTFGMNDVISHEAMISDIHLGMVLWQFQEAVLYVSIADSDERPNNQRLSEMAQDMQARLVASQ